MRALLLFALLALGGPAFGQYPFAVGGESFDQGFGVAHQVPQGGSLLGGAVVVGEFRESLDFDPGAGEHVLTAAGTRDAFVASYSEAGALEWAFRLGGPGVDGAHGVAIDGSGNVFVVGTFRESVDFDPGEEEHVLESYGQTDAFLASFTAEGDFRWAIQIGGEAFDQGHGVVAGGSRVCATGSFQGTATFDPDHGEVTFTSAGSYSMWIACYGAADGAFEWAHAAGGPGDFDRGWGITMDEAGDLFVTGDFTGEAQFDPAGEAEPVTALGLNDVFVASYTWDGQFRWVHRAGSEANDIGNRGNAITSGNYFTDPAVFVTGDIIGAADFPGGVILDVGDQRNVFAAAFSADGDLIWAHALPSDGPGRGTGISSIGLPGLQRIAVAGYFEGSLDLSSFDGPVIASPGGRSGFVVGLDPVGSGIYLSAHVLGGPENDQAYAVAGTASGYAYVTGSFGGTADFGGMPLTAVGPRDVFVSRHEFEVVIPSTEGGPGIAGPAVTVRGPNPFGDVTRVAVTARQPGAVRVEVFDMLGRRVALLHDAALAPDQEVELRIPPLAPGVYVVRAADASGASSVRVTRVR